MIHDPTVQTLIPRLPAGVQLVDRPESLSAIHDPACAATIWTRQAAPSFQTWIDALAPETLPRARIILPPDQVRPALEQIFHETGRDETERARLIDDIAVLARLFAQTMQAHHLRLRLDVINTDACRRFHRDVIKARLVCTYRGTGTQLGTGIQGQDPDQIYTVPTPSPIVMRGTRWSETPHTGLLHRSPPIAGTGETRLVLVLDPIDDPQTEI
ncbi:MAG: DUF1826 domain-containing protein [Pelagimonas sp.]|jgi:hypothetical protein|nr:DUF1826 domain-containing protein [Pelagimonas sp.]